MTFKTIDYLFEKIVINTVIDISSKDNNEIINDLHKIYFQFTFPKLSLIILKRLYLLNNSEPIKTDKNRSIRQNVRIIIHSTC